MASVGPLDVPGRSK
ncbi:Protein of unknown function [Propionibacterium freudenreichii]|nr:Protein of unknown function [Propionibacterium freudenreichii]CEI33276.1 Protein of unknown function [Propionibacterium freudenreichii]